MFYISLPTDKPFYSLRTTLDGADYELKFEWNMRAGWFLGMSAVGQNGTKTVISQPRRLLSNRDYLEFITHDQRPRGALIVIDGTGEGTPAGYEDLGTSHPLAYIPEEEYRAMVVAARG